MSPEQLKNIIEAALLAAAEPLPVERLLGMFSVTESPTRDAVHLALEQLHQDCAGRSIELREVGSGWRYQVRPEYAPWIARLWEERPVRYSRALLETLALIAYRQPITRPEIEDIRGVSVSTTTIKTLLEREWVRIVGYRDLPGKPAMYGTTRQFLDHFNLRGLDDLPALSALRDIENIELDLAFSDTSSHAVPPFVAPNDPTEDKLLSETSPL